MRLQTKKLYEQLCPNETIVSSGRNLSCGMAAAAAAFLNVRLKSCELKLNDCGCSVLQSNTYLEHY